MSTDIDLTSFTVTEDGLTVTNSRGLVLKQHVRGAGYLTINVSAKDTCGRKGKISIHRLVAFTYVHNPENKPCVNHIDGNKLNNHASNLEWVTHKENTAHAIKTGLKRNPAEYAGQPVKGTHVKTGEVVYLAKMKGNEGFTGQSISACCTGREKTHRGFRWERVQQMGEAHEKF